MQKEIEKYMELLFPKYKPSFYSRFTNLFQEITNKNKTFSEQEIISTKNFDIIISKIKNGDEKRGSIIIKSIPSLFGPKNFYDLLRNFTNKINFFFIPGYVWNQKEYMYAFVNVANNKEIINIVNGLTTIKNKYGSYYGFDLRYLEIYFSKTQGYKALKRKYKNECTSDFIIS